VATETVANDIKEISVIDTKKPKSVDVDEKTTAIIEDKTAHTSQVDVIQKKTDQWAIGDKTITKPNTGVSKTESAVAAVVVGAVTEAIVADKETATVIEDIIKKTDTVDVDVIVGEQEVDTVTKDKTISDSHIDVVVKETKQVVDDKETEVIGEEITVIDTTEVTGVISGTVTETIVKDKDTVSAIDTIVKDSDYITVEVIAGDKKTKAIIDTTTITDNTEVDTVTTGVVVGAVNEAIVTNKDVAKIIKDIVKKTDSVDIDIVVGEQDTDSTNKDKTTSDSQVQIIVKKTDVVVGEEETIVKTVEEVTGVTGVIAGTVTETIVKDKDTVSAIDTIVKESDSVNIEVIAEEEQPIVKRVTEVASGDETIVDRKEYISIIDIVSKSQGTTAGVVSGAVTEVIVGDEEVSSNVETIVKESDAIVIEVTVDGKTTKTIVDTSDVEKTVSKVDVATQESGKDNVSKAQVIAASIVAGAVAEIVKHKETTADETILTETDEVVIEVTVGDKKADSVVSSKNVEDKTGSKKIEVVIREHDVSSTEDKDQEIVVGTTEIVTTGVIAGTIVEAVVNDTIDTQRIISKSDSVDITVTETDATLVSSDNKVSVDTKVDVIVKETDETVKQEVNIGSETIPTSVVAGTLVAGIVSDKDTVDIIETTIKGSDKVNVEVITEDKPTSKVEKITDSESYAIGEVAGAIAETVVADKEKVSAIEQIIKKADDSVTVEVIAGDKKTETVIDKATVEEVVSEVDVVSKDSKVDTVKEIVAVGAAIGTVAVFDSDEKKNSPKEATIKDQVVDEVEESTVTETEVVSVAVGSDKSTKTKANEVVSTDSKVIEDVQVTTDVITVGEKDVTKTQIHEDKQVVVDVEDYKIEDVTKVDRIEGVVGEYDVQEDDTSKTTVTVSREITPGKMF
jgi:hypothetical protein